MNSFTPPVYSGALRGPCRNAPAFRVRLAANAPNRLDAPGAPEFSTTADCTVARATLSYPGIATSGRAYAVRNEALLVGYTDIVARIASHLFRRRRYVEINDLIGAGRVGLLAAIREYGHANARTFEFYANIRIREAMLEFVRQSDWSLRHLRGPLQRVDDEVTGLLLP